MINTRTICDETRQRLTNLQHVLNCRQNRRDGGAAIQSDCVGGTVDLV